MGKKVTTSRHVKGHLQIQIESLRQGKPRMVQPQATMHKLRCHSQFAPVLEFEGTPPEPAVPSPAPSSYQANHPFKPPAQANKRGIKAKQMIRRASSRRSHFPSNPVATSQPLPSATHAALVDIAGPSRETIATASAGTQRIFKFMATPELNKNSPGMNKN
ncbi:hypothetical protein PIB30_074997 [Stylosanthes scabra]|uniref:Uncharacterized protein n=1 Tax=Stylosanthes scabra TaxID=79078 RepID=A0ABU6UNK9_9FABA|nr:hypothetical protein [Stylosanthes scabra]